MHSYPPSCHPCHACPALHTLTCPRGAATLISIPIYSALVSGVMRDVPLYESLLQDLNTEEMSPQLVGRANCPPAS